MSDGHANETRELNLDAIAEWFEGKAENPDTLQDVSEWHAVRDLVAEVRRLREVEASVKALVAAAGEGFVTFGGGRSGGIVSARALRGIVGRESS